MAGHQVTGEHIPGRNPLCVIEPAVYRRIKLQELP